MYLSFIDDAFDRADNSSCPCPKGLKKLSDISDQNEGLKGGERDREREREEETDTERERDIYHYLCCQQYPIILYNHLLLLLFFKYFRISS